MRSYNRLCIFVFCVFLLLTYLLNAYLKQEKSKTFGIYRVEVKDLVNQINETGNYSLSDFPHLTGIYRGEGDDLYTSNHPYVIIRAAGQLYRVEYVTDEKNNSRTVLFAALIITFSLLVLLLLFIGKRLLVPFNKLTDVPSELAKGNLAIPIPEQKSRFFGKFTWGINLLRENMEESRQRELSMQRDKKMLLLSLSHDLKTPLSSIKLNAKALSKGLYTDEEKKKAALESINTRADEIESYVNQITNAARKDFMEFEVTPGEEFLGKILTRIKERYTPQLETTGTEFEIGPYEECILSCDPARLTECLQNLMDNAIKYGDGRKISLSFDKMDGRELITVTNTGCTLKQEELPQIFESFQRGSNASKSKGSGLGLFICKKLMLLMDGDIYADIKDECFLVTLVAKLA